MRSINKVVSIGLCLLFSACNGGWRLVDESEGRYQSKIEKLSYMNLPAEVKNGFSEHEFSGSPFYVCDTAGMNVSRYFVVEEDTRRREAGQYLRINGKKYFLDGTIANPIVVCDNSIYYTRDTGLRSHPDSVRNKVVFYRAEIIN